MTAQTKAWEQYYHRQIDKVESVSGVGSFLSNTIEIRQALPVLIQKYKIKTMLDVPCGDWNWMSHVDLSGVSYCGRDVIPEIIHRNTQRFPRHQFRVVDALKEVEYPRVDLVLCRDFLFHLPLRESLGLIDKVKKSGSAWFLSTSCMEEEYNEDLDIYGSWPGWRRLNLQRPPFSLPDPIEVIKENDSSACLGRVVALYSLKGAL